MGIKRVMIQKSRFEKIFYKFLVIGLMFFSLLFIFLSFILNEEFFKKYSEDEKLEKSTLDNINKLQKILLVSGAVFLLFSFGSVFLKTQIKEFIWKKETLLQNLILLFVVLILIFLVLEISGRVIFYNKTTSNAFGPPTLKFNKNYVHLNTEGFRDKDYDAEKKENITRITGLGDSFTYGWGIKNISDSYLKVLETELKERNEKKYEVLNFGVGGRYTDDELRILKENALKYSPDVVIIGYLPNDIRNVDKKIDEYKWTKIKVPLDFWFRNYLYSFFYLEIQTNNVIESLGKKPSYNEKMLEIFDSDINKDYNEGVWKDIKKLSENEGFEVLIVIFPIMYKFDDYPFIRIHDFVKEIAREKDFYVIDLLDTYRQYDADELILNKYDRHPNELGHKLAAEAIYDKLVNDDLA